MRMPSFGNVRAPFVPQNVSKHPGGKLLPDIEPFPNADDVQVWHDETAIPGDTVSFHNVNSVQKAFVWLDGVGVVEADVDDGRFVMPSRFYRNGTFRTVPQSVAIVWLGGNDGIRKPFRVNVPSIYLASRQNNLIYIYAANLLDADKFVVLAKLDSGEWLPLEAVRRGRFTLEAKIPDGWNGDVSLTVHNGTGGKYGWSEPYQVHVAPSLVPFPIIEVDSIDAADDTERIERANELAISSNGGILQFGPREYEIARPLVIGSPSIPVWLRGTLTLETTLVSRQGAKYIDICGPDTSIAFLNFENVIPKIRNVGASVFSNVFRLTCGEACLSTWVDIPGPVTQRRSARLVINHNQFYFNSSAIALNWLSDAVIMFNQFYGQYKDGVYDADGKLVGNNLSNNAIDVRSCHRVLISSNSACSNNVETGEILTRFYCGWHSSDSGIVIANNTLSNVAPFSTASNVDKNSGEAILFHADEVGMKAAIMWAHEDGSLTLDCSLDDLLSDEFKVYEANQATKLGLLDIGVTSGPSTGLFTRIVGARSHGNYVQVQTDRTIQANVGDEVVIRPMFRRCMVVDNRLRLMPGQSEVVHNSCGVMFWGSAYGTIVADNLISETVEAIRFQCANRSSWPQGPATIEGNKISVPVKSTLFGQYTKGIAIVGGGEFSTDKNSLHTFGISIRRNDIAGYELGASVGAYDFDRPQLGASTAIFHIPIGSGQQRTCIEGNTFRSLSVSDVALSTGAKGTLIRNNSTTRRKNDLLTFRPHAVESTVVITNDRKVVEAIG